MRATGLYTLQKSRVSCLQLKSCSFVQGETERKETKNPRICEDTGIVLILKLHDV